MREVGLRARKSFRIFQRPGKSLVLGPLARRGYIREENPSHRLRQPRTCAPRRVNLHSSRISDTWLRTFESLRRETMIPVKTRKISWTHCSNIRTVFTWYVTNVACAYDAYVRPRNAPTLLSRLSLSPLFHFVGFLSSPPSRRWTSTRRKVFRQSRRTWNDLRNC